MTPLLDTSVLLSDIPDELTGASLSVVTVAELSFGIAQLAAGPELDARSARLRLAQELFDPLPVDLAVASAWGKLAAYTASKGRQPRRRAMDLLIAATAQAHGLTVLTHDQDLLLLSDVLDVRRL